VGKPKVNFPSMKRKNVFGGNMKKAGHNDFRKPKEARKTRGASQGYRRGKILRKRCQEESISRNISASRKLGKEGKAGSFLNK